MNGSNQFAQAGASMKGAILTLDNTEVLNKKARYNTPEKDMSRNKIALNNIPILRGVVKTFGDLKTELRVLVLSIIAMESNEDEMKRNGFLATVVRVLYFTAIAIGIIVSFAMFVFVPAIIVSFLSFYITYEFLLSILESILRLIMLFLFIRVTHSISGIKTIYMYHAAQHKILNCIRQGNQLTLTNVKQASKYLKECSTYNLYILTIAVVLCLSICPLNENYAIASLTRIILALIIIGIVYEIKYCLKTDKSAGRICEHIQNFYLEEPNNDIINIVIKTHQKM